MSEPFESQSVTRWIHDLKAGDSLAAEKLWNRYYKQLVRLAYQKLRQSPRRVADEEDVALCALDSLFRRAQEGQFPKLEDRDDLWYLLVTITERKALNLMRDEHRLKRGGGKVSGESVFAHQEDRSSGGGIDDVAGTEPTPEFAATMTEAVQELFGVLDDEMRVIAQMKLEGYTNQQIAQRIDRSVPTVERRLSLIRDKWKGKGLE